MEVMEIIQIALVVVSVLTSGIIAVINSVKGKSKVSASEAKSLLVSEIIPQAVIKAEQSGVTTGNLKKTLAMSEIMLQCAQKGIQFMEYAEMIEQELEKLIATTKSVNSKNKNY